MRRRFAALLSWSYAKAISKLDEGPLRFQLLQAPSKLWPRAGRVSNAVDPSTGMLVEMRLKPTGLTGRLPAPCKFVTCPVKPTRTCGKF